MKTLYEIPAKIQTERGLEYPEDIIGETFKIINNEEKLILHIKTKHSSEEIPYKLYEAIYDDLEEELDEVGNTLTNITQKYESLLEQVNKCNKAIANVNELMEDTKFSNILSEEKVSEMIAEQLKIWNDKLEVMINTKSKEMEKRAKQLYNEVFNENLNKLQDGMNKPTTSMQDMLAAKTLGIYDEYLDMVKQGVRFTS